MMRALKYFPNLLATAVPMENSSLDRLQSSRKREEAVGEVGSFAISGVSVCSAMDITSGGSAGGAVTTSVEHYLKRDISNI